MRLKTLGILLATFVALAAWGAPASAIVVNTSNGRVSYVPLDGGTAGRAAEPKGFTVPTGEPPLEYHGGPVMHSQTAYAIFWAPSPYSFPAGYETAIESYFEDVAADSGKPSNVYSVSAQYTDGSGHASYSDSYGGSTTDTHAYGSSCSPYTGYEGETYSACITDEKLEAEVGDVVSEQGWPHGLGAEYYVMLPPHAGSCFEGDSECFDEVFCAYHGYAEPTPGNFEIYANISYSPGDVSGCGVGEYPNGHSNGNVDDTLSSLSHEANESITDPTLEAWYDEERLENGDECRNTPLEEDYGAPLGGASGALFNQAIGSGRYYLQQEWSNDAEDCVQRVGPASPSIAGPSEVVVGRSAVFDGGGSSPGDGGIRAYRWDFGDGATGTGPSPAHAFATTGVFAVKLSVEDDGGFSYSTSHDVTVVAEPQPSGSEASAPASTASASSAVGTSTPSPPAPKCRVPKLAGKTLRQARRALAAAHCTVGRVTKPKAHRGRKAGATVVRSSSPGAGAEPASGKVGLTLGHRPKPKKRHR